MVPYGTVTVILHRPNFLWWNFRRHFVSNNFGV